MNASHPLSDLEPADPLAIQILVSAAMDPDEGACALASVQKHFALARAGISDGRKYFVWREVGEVVGIVGLHHYEWGPKENVWLGWFAVAPSHQGRGIGKAMLRAVEAKAREAGYKKFFIETYDSPTFARAREFYTRQGFETVGTISNYLPNGAAMVVFCKLL